MIRYLKKEQLEKTSGGLPKLRGIQVLKRSNYLVLDQPVSGDAPKSFIKVYEFGVAKKSNTKNWPSYIAKTGHKWYPIESITEHLLNRLGEVLGLKMAQSKLVLAGGQIRFLSRYFLSKEQTLVHGAEIFYGYFENDKEFVDEIENKNLARDLLSLQVTERAINKFFPKQASEIMEEMVKMLLFDAWVGNNDRHFYNWGVVTHIAGRQQPYFSPVYDSARGLFWNFSEKRIVSLYNDLQSNNNKIHKYVLESRPKIGWEGEKNINHIRLVELISKHQYGLTKEQIFDFFSTQKLTLVKNLIEKEFRDLISHERMNIIYICIKKRIEKIREVI